ncbi:hypothetical protein BDI4_60104 [Burkholderia diffusa]|nr:hypothetical protein BDI4_60104 [Burkholderia diffusa]
MPAAFLRLSVMRRLGGLGRLRAAAAWTHQGAGEPAAGPWRAAWRVGGAIPRAGPCPWDDNHGPARAVVTPPHLPAKMNGFYALMHPALGAAGRGPRGGQRPDSSMQFYAPWLCNVVRMQTSCTLQPFKYVRGDYVGSVRGASHLLCIDRAYACFGGHIGNRSLGLQRSGSAWGAIHWV